MALLCLPTASNGLQTGGTVFVDRDADGVRDAGEPGLSAVAVSNGREVVETDSEGRYALSPGPDGLVFITRPSGYDCAGWVRQGGGDFALIPADRPDEFFFIHLSDVHAYRHSSQVWEDYGVAPPYVPTAVAAWFAVWDFEERLVPRWTDALLPQLRAALAANGADADGSELMLPARYFEELFRSGSALGRAEDAMRKAFAEVHALEPEFLINTGDIVFDSNRVPPEVSADWMALYRSVAERPGRPVYNSIGNHELGRIEHEGVSSDDPGYGPGFFRTHFGSSAYSFERGGFHFAALDTHSPGHGEGHDAWRRNRMRPEVSAWLAADLERSRRRGLTAVILNHEPFFGDPDWNQGEEFDELELVDDEGLLARHGVAYTMTGHVHFPGSARSGPTTHISTGALSGAHWLLPASAHPRGYRLVYAHSGRLYSAWKLTGEPVLQFVDSEPGDVVAVAADERGPFAQIRLLLDGEPLPTESWGNYFVRARVEPDALKNGNLRVEAIRDSGEKLAAERD